MRVREEARVQEEDKAPEGGRIPPEGGRIPPEGEEAWVEDVVWALAEIVFALRAMRRFRIPGVFRALK